MVIVSRKTMFILNILVGLMVLMFISLRLHNSGIIDLRFHASISVREFDSATAKKKKLTPKTPFKIPWRFHIEQDGFVFPVQDNKERFLTYERTNGSWTKQILQFENANIFAFILKRTLLIPPLCPYKSDTDKSYSYFMSQIIDFDLLSTMVKLGEIDLHQYERIQLMKSYTVCHDPRLGFWLDYIPSTENIQTWRLLKEQYFSPSKLKVLKNNNSDAEDKQLGCPGNEGYVSRWGPPLRVKAMYRGILTELYDRKEDLIYLQRDTLDTRHIRFFNKQRTQKAQELLLFYIRFSKKITKKTKRIAKLLGPGYTAILANYIYENGSRIDSFLSNKVEGFSQNSTSKNIFIVCDKTKRHFFQKLATKGFELVFADDFILKHLPETEKEFLGDKVHLLSLLLCAYATYFIGLPGTSDLYFVEHLRLQDTKMIDGLVTDKVSVRWAKHTTRDKADERKVLLRPTLPPVPSYKNIRILQQRKPKSNISVSHTSTIITKLKRSEPKAKRKVDRLNSIACMFCNYVKYVTGKHGCPSMRYKCSL